ncbi:hypothetical protein AAHA92_15174 [Salvia divinorum]|uniref:Secreted protein n=1 Tax=Salvia divinorum TaxID=28513 RepID=A0ABD1HDU7_SALDI
MLQLLFTVAFSVAPLILYVPPLRSLNLFVETAAYLFRDALSYFHSVSPRLRVAISRFLSPHIAAAGR